MNWIGTDVRLNWAEYNLKDMKSVQKWSGTELNWIGSDVWLNWAEDNVNDIKSVQKRSGR